MKSKSFTIVDQFSPEARTLRAQFDERLKDPRDPRADRFVWDYWHVPGQYTHLKTPAYEFFSQSVYKKLHARLVRFGREVLGCHDISPPWLSCYVDGCRQELHGDLPHGPWAFVFSLTPWRNRKFKGGETVLIREKILDYWRHQPFLGGLEERAIFESIPAEFNRLVVFDPRVPHGVRRVEGTEDPREGRLVIHGWFLQPRPFIEGPLAAGAVQSWLGEKMEDLRPIIEEVGGLSGMLSMRFTVARTGSITGVRLLADSVKSVDGKSLDGFPTRLLRALFSGERPFARQRGVSQVTLPIIFDPT
jgi:hypothetical protein